MSFENILTEVRGRVGIVTMNRPDVLNAMTAQMLSEIREQIQTWNGDDSVGAIVLTGAGRGFCSGADISRFERAVEGGPKEGGIPSTDSNWSELIKQSKPIICAINGVAVGQGITMTLPCDVRVASDNARMSFRFVRIGLTPEYGSTHYLPYLVGLGRTLELMLSGRFVQADEAYRIGLINHVFAADELLDKAVELAQEIAGNPIWQLEQTKRQIHAHYLEHDITKIHEIETEIFRKSQETDSHKEALIAFRERREPRFHE